MKSKQTRLRVLKLAERLENVAEACRQSGVNRASFYGWRKRYLDEGPDGLTVRSPKRRVYPQKSSPQLVHKIRELSLTHPAFGCDRIGPLVSKEGQAISSVSVQKILHTLGLGTRSLRWLALEDQYRQSQNTLSPEQIEFIEQQNPAFRDRSVGRSRCNLDRLRDVHRGCGGHGERPPVGRIVRRHDAEGEHRSAR